MDFKKYPSYKNSGVEWLGEVPAHWEVKKIKRLSPVNRGASPRPINDLKYFDDNGEYAWVRISDVTRSNGFLLKTEQRLSVLGSSYSVKLEPESLFLSIAATVGKPCITKIKTCIHDGFVYFPKLKKHRDLLFNIFESKLCFVGLGKLGTQLNLNSETVEDIYIAIPPESEEQLILEYIQHETARIDNLIAKQEKLIELLEEQRKSIISHAVTKGLDPNAPMKDSGVEWLGEVPEHWMTPSIKHLLQIPITDGPHETPNFVDDGVPFISAEAISKGKIDFEKKRGYITPELNEIYRKKYSPKIEDIYMVKSGATTGKVAMVETTDEFNIWSPLAVFRCNKNKILPKFLLAVFNSSHFYDALVLNWSYGTQQNIGMGVLSNIEIPCPPLHEQTEIIQYLDAENIKFDKLISTQSQLIEKLKEYRSSIISHAVTGKIDVRGIC